MKSIILSSSIHAYDVMLCHFQDTFQHFSSKHLSGPRDPTPAELHPPSSRFEQCLHAESVASESLKLAHQCHYALQSTENKTFEEVAALWLQRSGLQESLEVLEVFDFVYGFLCQHTNCSDPNSFIDWIYEEDWMDDQEEEWAFFVKSIRLVLNPADILELLLFTSLWGEKTSSPSQTWSKEIKRDYLRVRGFFDSGFPGQVTTL
ncbi:hypothetical protein K469DRAFT_750127 [Zopfia rhizophila CBS 207.26]|uniref:Uncharacterized protein n=1 Tax=Zopfia rhizophila CBS 207.26 TaxID=1314779 RepID=A0A6A6E5G5_9PEZI|nr:hypothetical protein K469DRAFT_750127 [Zopfia rhizophila CBS 207.26]